MTTHTSWPVTATALNQRPAANRAIYFVLSRKNPRTLLRTTEVCRALAGWGLGHGLASLYLDRKLTASSSTAIAAPVCASFLAAF
ncbi:MAG: hypothetical protein ACRDPL_06090 [Propionibacteriaceae bacterium]